MARQIDEDITDVGSTDVSRETPADVSRETGQSVSQTPAEVTQGAGLVLRPDSTEEDTPIGAAAARATRVQHPGGESLPRPDHCRIITVANQKGGVGKTTSTVNLAAALALHNITVLVVDLDPQGNASTALGVPHHSGTPSIYEVLLGEMPLRAAIQTSTHSENLLCVPATIDLAGAEIELVSLVAREGRLKRALDAKVLEELGVDFVLIDCPPSLGLLTVNALVAAPEVLIPIQCEYYALEGLGQLLSNIELVQAHLNPELHVSTILLTMYDGRTRLADQVVEEVRSHFGDVVLQTMIPRSVKVSEAPGYGQTVLSYDPGSRGAMSYLDAGREFGARGDITLNPSVSVPDEVPASPSSSSQERSREGFANDQGERR